MYRYCMDTPHATQEVDDFLKGIDLTEDQVALKASLDALRMDLEVTDQLKQVQSIPLLKEIAFWVEGAPLLIGYGEALSKEKKSKQ
jgi:hypothetical protein